MSKSSSESPPGHARQYERFVPEGEGLRLPVGTRTELTGRSDWAKDAYCILDQLIAPGLISAPHTHQHEDQAAIVLEGRLGFWVDGSEFEAGPGDYVQRPAGLPHALWNPGREVARIYEITSPGAGFQSYMIELGEMAKAGAADPDRVRAHASDYGITFLADGTNEELCARHGVSPAGGFWK